MDADAIADSNSFDVSGTSVALLQGFLNATPVVSIDDAIEILRAYCPHCSPQVALDTLVANKWEVAQITIDGFANEDYKCAVRIYTAEKPFPFYKWTNAPFFSKRRCEESLRLHAPYVKLLLLAVQQLMSLPAFAYEGAGYRGLKLDGNAELKRKYLDYKNEFVVGQLMTFPAFMSVSTDDSVADDFGDFVFFVFVKVRGARVARLSQLPKEAEILVPPPSVFRIKAVAKVGTTKSFVGGHEVKSGGRLTVTLEQESCPLTYLSQKASVAHVASTAAPAAVSLPPAVASEDPKVLALSKALEALDVASAALCLKFAKALDEQGILTMERLKKLPEADAREALEAAGMKKLQVRSVMEAIASSSSVAASSPPSAPPASAPAAKKIPAEFNPLAPHLFGIPISCSRDFEVMLPLRVAGANLNSEGLGFLSKFLSESILTCHRSYDKYPYSEVQIDSCASLFNATRLAAFERLPGDCFMAIHGTTSASNVSSISANGFRPSPAGCFGRGIYVAQNSSVALVHTVPKGCSFEDHMAGHLNLILCFVKITSHDSVMFPPKPAMEMIYNGFPSTSDQLSKSDLLIGDMPHRFREAVVNDTNRVYAAWHLRVRVLKGRSELAHWSRSLLHQGIGYLGFSVGAIRLRNGAVAVCRFYSHTFFSAEPALLPAAALTPLQWAVIDRNFIECARLLRSGANAVYERPDFTLQELLQPLPVYTVPKLLLHATCGSGPNTGTLGAVDLASLGLRGLAQHELHEKLLDVIANSQPDSVEEYHGDNHGYGRHSPRVLFQPFHDLLPVLKRIYASPSKKLDQVAEAELVKIETTRGIVRHGAYLYRTLELRFYDVPKGDMFRPNFRTLVEIPAGWTIALGDADDRHVVCSHYWQSDYLVFSDGRAWPTKINTAERSGVSFFHPSTKEEYNVHQVDYLCQKGTKVCASESEGDVLLFKTA